MVMRTDTFTSLALIDRFLLLNRLPLPPKSAPLIFSAICAGLLRVPLSGSQFEVADLEAATELVERLGVGKEAERPQSVIQISRLVDGDTFMLSIPHFLLLHVQDYFSEEVCFMSASLGKPPSHLPLFCVAGRIVSCDQNRLDR